MDILKVIEDLKERLWAKYGDVLKREWSQDDVHMTYYAGDILEKHGHQHRVVEGTTYYTERAMQDAFIAGLRVGRKDAVEMTNREVSRRLSAAISYLEGYDVD